MKSLVNIVLLYFTCFNILKFCGFVSWDWRFSSTIWVKSSPRRGTLFTTLVTQTHIEKLNSYSLNSHQFEMPAWIWQLFKNGSFLSMSIACIKDCARPGFLVSPLSQRLCAVGRLELSTQYSFPKDTGITNMGYLIDCCRFSLVFPAASQSMPSLQNH